MKTDKNDNTSQLLCRWTMLLAHALIEDGIAWQEALTQAHLTRRLLEALGKGAVEFEYKKENGETRMAHGTLCRGIDPAFDGYVGKGVKERRNNSNTEGIYTYWDLDRHAFRTFKAAQLMKNEESK